MTLAIAVCLLWQFLAVNAVYFPVHEHSGNDFFNGWNYYGNWDDTNSGDDWNLNQADAISQKLTFVNNAGNAIIKVDNTSVVAQNEKRNSIRITTQESWGVGTLFIIDVLHMPYGCSVWPAIWTKGTGKWPDTGEIDIVEGVNMRTFNQMALHTINGCVQDSSAKQIGRTTTTNCDSSGTDGTGCVVQETKPNSYGPSFASAGGGVFAAQFDVSGIFVWFWSRPDIPNSIKGATSTSTMDVADWGTPSASWPASSCNITKYFQAQQMVINISLCGIFGKAVYNETCHTRTQTCYDDNVVGPGSPTYDNAYFEIPYVRIYSVNPANNSSTTSNSNSNPSPSGASGADSSASTSPSSAERFNIDWRILIGVLMVLASAL